MKEKLELKNDKAKSEKPAGLNRVTYDSEARSQLDKVVEKVRNGREELSVDRNEVAKFLLANCLRLLSESDIQEIRSACFSELNSLAALCKQAGKDSDLPLEIREMLRKHYGVSDLPKKKKQKEFGSDKTTAAPVEADSLPNSL